MNDTTKKLLVPGESYKELPPHGRAGCVRMRGRTEDEAEAPEKEDREAKKKLKAEKQRRRRLNRTKKDTQSKRQQKCVILYT